VAGTRVSLEEIVAAGRELFGPGFAPDRTGWREDLRAAYRRRAMETHPDRAQAVGRCEADLVREFRRVSEAYRVLSDHRATSVPRRAPAPPRSPAGPVHTRPPAPPPRPARAAAPDPEPAAGELPRRKLRLAEYLYYSGRVPWSAFTDAIAWQRRQRPALGRLAVAAGYLTADQVARLLDRRRASGEQAVPIGEFAVRHGALTPFQLLALLGRQVRLQRRIGEFFVEQGLLARDEIDELRRKIAWHNARQGPAR
jgi:DnaJ-like protein